MIISPISNCTLATLRGNYDDLVLLKQQMTSQLDVAKVCIPCASIIYNQWMSRKKTSH